MAQITGMNQKVRRTVERVDPVDGLLQSRGYISVGCLVEADMTVTDLNEAEARGSAHLVIRHLAEGF
jgi:hypothetical protein